MALGSGAGDQCPIIGGTCKLVEIMCAMGEKLSRLLASAMGRAGWSALVAGLLGLAVGVLAMSSSRLGDREGDAELQALLARQVAGRLADSMAGMDLLALQAWLQELQTEPRVLAVEVRDATGTLLGAHGSWQEDWPVWSASLPLSGGGSGRLALQLRPASGTEPGWLSWWWLLALGAGLVGLAPLASAPAG